MLGEYCRKCAVSRISEEDFLLAKNTLALDKMQRNGGAVAERAVLGVLTITVMEYKWSAC